MKNISHVLFDFSDSDSINVTMDKKCCEYIRGINGSHDHGKLTNGVIGYAILSMFSDEIEFDDKLTNYENRLDEDLISYGVSPETVNELTNSTFEPADGSDNMELYFPATVKDQLEEINHFKSDVIEPLVIEYIESPFSSRSDRIGFKEVLLECLEEEQDYTQVAMSNKFRALFENNADLQDVVRQNEWYESLSYEEVIERADDSTKVDREARLTVISTVFEKIKEEYVDHFSTSENLYTAFGKFESFLPFNSVKGLISEMYDVSEPTVNTYAEELEWDIDMLKEEIIKNVDHEKLVIDLGYIVEKGDHHSKILDTNNIVHNYVHAYIDKYGSVTFRNDNVKYKAYLEGDNDGDIFKIRQVE